MTQFTLTIGHLITFQLSVRNFIEKRHLYKITKYLGTNLGHLGGTRSLAPWQMSACSPVPLRRSHCSIELQAYFQTARNYLELYIFEVLVAAEEYGRLFEVL